MTSVAGCSASVSLDCILPYIGLIAVDIARRSMSRAGRSESSSSLLLLQRKSIWFRREDQTSFAPQSMASALALTSVRGVAPPRANDANARSHRALSRRPRHRAWSVSVHAASAGEGSSADSSSRASDPPGPPRGRSVSRGRRGGGR